MEYIDEVEEAENALKTLNCQLIEVINESLPFSKDARTILKIKKISKTDEKFPRKAGKALKKPL